ncbi:MAG: hypothetical protein ACKVZJ_06760 [Phycisphaerales bacterium]
MSNAFHRLEAGATKPPNPVIRSVRAMSRRGVHLGRVDDARMILKQTRENMNHPWAYDQPGAKNYFDAAVKLIEGDPASDTP